MDVEEDVVDDLGSGEQGELEDVRVVGRVSLPGIRACLREEGKKYRRGMGEKAQRMLKTNLPLAIRGVVQNVAEKKGMGERDIWTVMLKNKELNDIISSAQQQSAGAKGSGNREDDAIVYDNVKLLTQPQNLANVQTFVENDPSLLPRVLHGILSVDIPNSHLSLKGESEGPRDYRLTQVIFPSLHLILLHFTSHSVLFPSDSALEFASPCLLIDLIE